MVCLVASIVAFSHFALTPRCQRYSLWCLAGCCWIGLYSNFFAPWQLPEEWIGKNLSVQGVVSSVPLRSDEAQRFELRTNQLCFKAHCVKRRARLRLSWYRAPDVKLRAGDEWQLTVRVKPPHGYGNPGSYPVEQAALAQKISAHGYVVAKQAHRFVSHRWYRHPVNQLRQRLYQRISASKLPYSAMITALSLGLRSGFDNQQWQVLQNTGTNHLLAISGLHIGLVAGLFYSLVSVLWRLSARACDVMATPRIAAMAAVIAAGSYSLLAGFTLATERAFIMVAVFACARFFVRSHNVWQSYCLALFICLLLNPFALLTAGFWLSFSAVAVLLLGFANRVGTMPRWKSLLQAQLLVLIGLLPITLFYFQQFSIISIVANSVAIPWVGFVIVPLSLLASIVSFSHTLGGVLLWFANTNLTALWWLLAKLSAMPHSVWHHGIASPWTLPLGVIGVGLLLLPRGVPGKWLGLLWLLPVLFYRGETVAPNSFKLTMLDVGQGLSVIIRTSNHVLVYDTGRSFPSGTDLGKQVVVPYLRTQNIHKLDKIVISHGDNDHSGGLQSVMQAYPHTEVVSSAPKKLKVTGVNQCLAGQQWQWDGVIFEFLYPTESTLGRNNDSSCVLKISAGKYSALLPGDIEHYGENYLVHHVANLKSNILIAPHHGSSTSSTETFLQAVQPQYGLISAGFYNRYHFPRADVIERYARQGSIILNTGNSGMVTAVMDPQNGISNLQGFVGH